MYMYFDFGSNLQCPRKVGHTTSESGIFFFSILTEHHFFGKTSVPPQKDSFRIVPRWLEPNVSLYGEKTTAKSKNVFCFFSILEELEEVA